MEAVAHRLPAPGQILHGAWDAPWPNVCALHLGASFLLLHADGHQSRDGHQSLKLFETNP